MSKGFRYNKLDFKKSFFARGIKVNGQIYLSLSHAARILNESRTHLVRKCLDEKNNNYLFVEPKTTQKYAFRKACACQINKISYKSLSQAGKALNLNHKTIKHRILSDKYDYVFLNKMNRSNDYPEGE
jgi:NUMOD1 domain